MTRWSSLQNTRSRGRGWIQIQLLPPYIDLNLPVSTPWSLNPPIPTPKPTISTPKPTNLHPLDVDPTPPPGCLFCSEGLLHMTTESSQPGKWVSVPCHCDIALLHVIFGPSSTRTKQPWLLWSDWLFKIGILFVALLGTIYRVPLAQRQINVSTVFLGLTYLSPSDNKFHHLELV